MFWTLGAAAGLLLLAIIAAMTASETPACFRAIRSFAERENWAGCELIVEITMLSLIPAFTILTTESLVFVNCYAEAIPRHRKRTTKRTRVFIVFVSLNQLF